MYRSAHLLNDIVKKLPDGAEVTIDVANGTAAVQAGRSNFKLPTLPVEDFPAFNNSEFPVQFVSAADISIRSIQLVLPYQPKRHIII